MISLNKVKLEKHEEVVKQVLTLYKIRNVIARVVIVFDISGSMYHLYDRETVHNVLLRLFAVAKQFDDNGSLDSYIFSTDFARLPEITMENFENYIRSEILLKFEGGYMDYRQKAIQKIEDEISRLKADFKGKSKGGFLGFGKSKVSPEEEQAFNEKNAQLQKELDVAKRSPVDKRMKIFHENNEPAVMRDIVKKYTIEEPSDVPTYVMFISDGGVSQDAEIERIIRESSDKPLFWQFIGLGRANYGALAKLDDLSGRVVDNANFFALDDIDKISDEELYKRLLKEFPTWLQEAGKAGILK